MEIVEGFELSMKVLERTPSGEGSVAEVLPFIPSTQALTHGERCIERSIVMAMNSLTLIFMMTFY